MKAVGYALITLGAVALVRGLWLMTPVAGWIGLALVLYVAGYHLRGAESERRRNDVRPQPPPPGPRRPSVIVHDQVGEA